MSNRNRDERDYDERERAQRERYSTTGYNEDYESGRQASRGDAGREYGTRGRSDRDIQSDYSGGGYDQVGAYGSDRGYEPGRETRGQEQSRWQGAGRYGSEGDRLHGYQRGGREWEGRSAYEGAARGQQARGAQDWRRTQGGTQQAYGSQDFERESQGYGSQGYGSQGYGSQGYGSQGYGAQERGSLGGNRSLQGASSGYSDYSRDMPRGDLGRSGWEGSRSLSGQDLGYGGSRESGGYGAQTGEQGRYGSMGYRGLGPKNYTRSDDRIREDLNERLTDADDLDASGLSVEVNNGIATLSGSVGQRWMKHRAEDIAESCSGVRDVRNQIQVSQSSWNQGPSAGTSSASSGTTGLGSGTSASGGTGASASGSGASATRSSTTGSTGSTGSSQGTSV